MDEIYKLWFDHPEWWFNCGSDVDEYITELFNTYLVKNSYENVFTFTTKEAVIGTLIFYDQFPRHVYRKSANSSYYIEYYLKFALLLSDYIIENKDINLLDSNVNAYEWTFIYLPQRHSDNIERILSTISHAWNKLKFIDEKNIAEKTHMYKFLKASYMRCPLIQEGLVKKYCPSVNSIWHAHFNSLKHKKILGYVPDESHSIRGTFDNVIDKIDSMHTIIRSVIDVKKRYILSLSGGVDSMICSYILKTLGVEFCAVHINYCNRDECEYEEEFLEDWCCNYLDIDLYIRALSEIQRQPCIDADLRSVYEEYTRNVRLNTYTYVWNVFKKDDDEVIPQIILGHNNDDCFENIMTNIAHCSKYDNLLGMTKNGIQDGICFIRPLLSIPKSEIYKFSREWGIPHLPTSTPSWSMRGQIRDSVRPCLEKWHTDSVRGFFEVSSTMSELYGLMNSMVDRILEKMDDNEKNVKVYPSRIMYGRWSCEMSEIQESCLFWKTLLIKMTKKIPSNKSLEYFKIHLIKFKSRSDTIRKISVKINEYIHIDMRNDANIISIFISSTKFY